MCPLKLIVGQHLAPASAAFASLNELHLLRPHLLQERRNLTPRKSIAPALLQIGTHNLVTRLSEHGHSKLRIIKYDMSDDGDILSVTLSRNADGELISMVWSEFRGRRTASEGAVVAEWRFWNPLKHLHFKTPTGVSKFLTVPMLDEMYASAMGEYENYSIKDHAVARTTDDEMTDGSNSDDYSDSDDYLGSENDLDSDDDLDRDDDLDSEGSDEGEPSIEDSDVEIGNYMSMEGDMGEVLDSEGAWSDTESE